MRTALALEAELAGEERAIRHLIGERQAITHKLAREHALEKLTQARLHAITTRHHPVVHPRPGVPAGARFPDVSSYQPNVDWAAVRHASSVRAGELAVTKLTEGGGWTDPYGAIRLREMAAQGFAHRGGYGFLHPSIAPIEQATHLLEAAHADGVVIRETDVLICDAEVTDGQPPQVVRACVREFGQELRKHVPAKLWLYTGGPFAHENGLTLAGYDAHWLPAYTGDPSPYMVFGRQRVIAWQYTDGRYGPVPHVCPGIGACDMSIIL